MTTAVTYDPTTGEIVASLSGPEPIRVSQAARPGCDVKILEGVELIRPNEHYVFNDQVIERPTMELVANGTRVTGIPDGAKVLLEGDAQDEFVMDDSGVVNFDLDPGDYALRVECFPYKKAFIVWTVNP